MNYRTQGSNFPADVDADQLYMSSTFWSSKVSPASSFVKLTFLPLSKNHFHSNSPWNYVCKEIEVRSPSPLFVCGGSFALLVMVPCAMLVPRVSKEQKILEDKILSFHKRCDVICVLHQSVIFQIHTLSNIIFLILYVTGSRQMLPALLLVWICIDSPYHVDCFSLPYHVLTSLPLSFFQLISY